MKYENSWTQPGEGFLKELKLNEIDFASADALKSYKSKHTIKKLIALTNETNDVFTKERDNL